MDWKQIVQQAAPVLGGLLTAVGGPAGALAGAGVTILAKALTGASTGDPVADQRAVELALSGGMTPEIRAKLIEADNQIKLELIKAGVREKEIVAELEHAHLADVQGARVELGKVQTSGDAPWYVKAQQPVLAALAVLTFIAVLIGLFDLMTAGRPIDPALRDIMVFVLGCLTSIVLTVYTYFFGSSKGSDDKTKMLSPTR